ncbi:hypothetical protein IJG04_01560 [Candidatus Saccharibacteria bacterium]|nr:hypothetical protein [Candidatus Saccharibacteria bacterium]
MNKDVVYIEPEDDITDIITKIENSKERIVALVPPKKAGVFRSIVNIKLIAKAGASAEKTIVLVTVDPSIVKLAAATRLPVTKNLQSAPVIPELKGDEVINAQVSREEIVESPDGEVEVAEVDEIEVHDNSEDEPEEDAEDADDTEDAEDAKNLEEDDGSSDEADEVAGDEQTNNKNDGKDKKQAKTSKKSHKNGAKANKDAQKFSKEWFLAHKRLVIGCGVGLVVLILVLVWMFVIAPAVTVNVRVQTTTANFSEGVSFTTDVSKENAEDGVFYLTEKKIEIPTEVEFEATGEKNIGEKATGSVVVYTYIDSEGGTTVVNAGDSFTNNGLTYIANDGVRLSYNGKDTSVCSNENAPASEFMQKGCMVSGRVNVTASEPGTKYNLAASDLGWSTTADVYVYSDKAMSGGTDDIITVVQQSDVEKAKEEISTSAESENKQKLLDSIKEEDAFIIEASFAQSVGNATSTPAVGEEVKSGSKAKLTVVTTDTVFIIDEAKVKEFIEEKAKIDENYKIYEMKDPFIENFTKTDSGYIGKLKTSYTSGPSITENEVIEMVKGKGIGTATHDLNDMNGVSVNITTSFPWVNSVPNDANKITVFIDSGDQSGAGSQNKTENQDEDS